MESNLSPSTPPSVSLLDDTSKPSDNIEDMFDTDDTNPFLILDNNKVDSTNCRKKGLKVAFCDHSYSDDAMEINAPHSPDLAASENAQRLTQDVPNLTSPVVKEKVRKRAHSSSHEGRDTVERHTSYIIKENEEAFNDISKWIETQTNSRHITMPPWLLAETSLRESKWHHSKLRSIVRSAYQVPETNGEYVTYNVNQGRTTFFIRIACSFLKPTKVTLGSKGLNMKKIEFPSDYTDLFISAINSMIKGARSKSILITQSREKILLHSTSEGLSITQMFPSDTKKYATKNNLNEFLTPSDIQITIPLCEIDILLKNVRFGSI